MSVYSSLSPPAQRLIRFWMTLDYNKNHAPAGSPNGGQFVGSGMGGLNGYSEHQLNNWAGAKNIVVCTSEKQLTHFIRNALSDHQYHPKLYFGTVPAKMADQIKEKTGIDVNGFNVTLGADEVRKINKKHGDDKHEALQGQRGITESDFKSVLDIITHPDDIVRDQDDYLGNPVLIFKKKIGTVVTAVTFASNARRDLRLQTMYAKRK